MTTPLDLITHIVTTEPAETGWQAVCDAARSAAADEGMNRWLIGDLALLVDKQYGRNRIGEFAVQANMPVSTVKQYRRVSSFYENDTRVSFENLSYTHFRSAMALKDDAVTVLTEAASNQWTTERLTVEVAARRGKKITAKKLLDVEAEIRGGSLLNGTLTLWIAEGDLLATVIDYKRVRVKLYEVEEA